MSQPLTHLCPRRAQPASGAADASGRSSSGAPVVPDNRPSVSPAPSAATTNTVATLVNQPALTAPSDEVVPETPPATLELELPAAAPSDDEESSLSEESSSSEHSFSEDDGEDESASEEDASATVALIVPFSANHADSSDNDSEVAAPAIRTTATRTAATRPQRSSSPESDSDSSVVSVDDELAIALDRLVTQTADGHDHDGAIDEAFRAVESLLTPIRDEAGPADDFQGLFELLARCSEVLVSPSLLPRLLTLHLLLVCC